MSKHLYLKYYQENKERLQKKHEIYYNLSMEEKGKKQQYGREHYKNHSEDEQNKTIEYRKKCYKIRKNALL